MKTFSIHFAARCGAAVLLLLSGQAHAQSDPGMSKSPDGANAGAAPSLGAPKDPGSVKVPPPTGTVVLVFLLFFVVFGFVGFFGFFVCVSRKKTEKKSKRNQHGGQDREPQAK